MEGVKLADWFFVAGGLSGLVNLMLVLRFWKSFRVGGKIRKISFILLGLTAFFLVMAGNLKSSQPNVQTEANQ